MPTRTHTPPTRTLALGTYNLRNTVPALAGYNAVRAFLPDVDVLAVQEADQLRGDRAALRALRGYGFGHTHPHAGNMILYRLDRLELITEWHPLIAHGRRCGYVPGRRTVLPDYHATLAAFRFVDGLDGFLLGGVHTPAHSRFGGARQAMWYDGERGLVDDLEHGRRDLGPVAHGPTFAAGDWNRPLPGRRRDFPALRAAGAVSCFDGMRHPPATRHRETIDGVWVLDGGARFRDVSVHHARPEPSDHRKVRTLATWSTRG